MFILFWLFNVFMHEMFYIYKIQEIVICYKNSLYTTYHS